MVNIVGVVLIEDMIFEAPFRPLKTCAYGCAVSLQELINRDKWLCSLHTRLLTHALAGDVS